MHTFSATDTCAKALEELRLEYAGIEDRKVELKTAIRVLEARITGQMGLKLNEEAGNGRGPYAGMNLKPAILLVLQQAIGPLSNRDVRTRLEEGGWHSESKNPGGLVNRAIRTLKLNGDVVPHGRGLYRISEPEGC